MQRIGVLNGNNITYDHDLAGLVRGLTDSGVIQGGEISGNKIQPVQAVIACQRSNGQKLMLYFESDEQVSIPSSWTFKVYIEVNQAKIDDGTGNAENWTWIAEIKTWSSVPSQNSLLLASVADWVVKDERNLIPKIQSVAQRTDSLEEKITTAEGQISQLVAKWTPDHLAVYWIVGSEYSEWDKLYKVRIPREEYSRNGKGCAFWFPNGKEFEVAYLLNGTSFQSIGLFLGRVGSPMDWITVEVRNAVPSGNSVATYKAGDILYATWSILPIEIDESLKKIEVLLNNLVALEKGQKIVLTIKRTGTNYDTANFYYLGHVSLENNNKKVGLLEVIRIWANNDPVRMNMMIPITCPGIEQELFLNKNTNYQLRNILNQEFTFSNAWAEEERTLNISASWRYRIKIKAKWISTFSFYLKQGNKKIKDLPSHSYNASWVEYDWGEVDLEKWECKVVCRIAQYSNSMNCEISLISDFTEGKMCYIADHMSDIGEREKFIFFGKYKDNWKTLEDLDYPKWIVNEISVTQGWEIKQMTTPCPWIVILSAWTSYREVYCSVNWIKIISLYNHDSWTKSETATVPVKGWENIQVGKGNDWWASAKFISL